MYTIDAIIDRIDYLRAAIGYSRDRQRGMSVEQGIACQQEIAGWYRVMDSVCKMPPYTIPAHLEAKVVAIHDLIKTEQWTKPEINY